MQQWIDGELWHVSLSMKKDRNYETVTPTFAPLDETTGQINARYFTSMPPGTEFEMSGLQIDGTQARPKGIISGKVREVSFTNTSWEDGFRIPVMVNDDGITCSATIALRLSIAQSKDDSLVNALYNYIPSVSDWWKAPIGSIVKGAPMLINGEPQSCLKMINGLELFDKKVQFGNSRGASAFCYWVKVSPLLFICDRNLANNISWEDLDSKGLVTGTPMLIDGILFRARLITADYRARGSNNEWSTYMRGTRATSWNDKITSSWTKSLTGGKAVRVVGGGKVQEIDTDIRDTHIGWRPALEMIG